MTTVRTQTEAANVMLSRVTLVLTNPKGCWSQIAAETSSPVELLKTIYLPLALVGALSSIIGASIFGIPVPFIGTMHPGLGSLITQYVSQIACSVAGLFLASFILTKLAPLFGGTGFFAKTFSLVVHANIPGLLTGILGLLPFLLPASLLLVLYGLYLLFCGIPAMTNVPPRRRVGFVVTSILAIVIIQLVMIQIAGNFSPTPASELTP